MTKKSGSQADGKRGAPTWPTDPFELVIIGLDTKDGPDHHLYDAESLAYNAEADEDMIANVRHLGILKPILFMRDGERKIVIDGRSRVRWARAATKLQRAAGQPPVMVPGIVKRGTPADLFGISRAAQRHRPDDSELAQARDLQRMTDLLQDKDAARVKLGYGKPRAKQLLAVLDLHPKIQRRVGVDISLDAAAKLAKLSQTDQLSRMAEIAASGDKPTAARVKNKLREADGKAPVESAAKKLKAIRDLVDAYQTSLLHMNPEDQEDAHAEAFSCLTKIRKIVYPPATDKTPEADRPRLTNRELHPEEFP